MNVVQLRTWFKNLSGRQDMADADIDQLLNAGQKKLDDMTEFRHSKARYFEILAQGDYMITFSSLCQAIHNVWIISASDDSRTELEKVDYNDLRAWYQEAATGLSQDLPQYYAPGVLRTIPEGMNAVTFATYVDYMDISWGSPNAVDGIVFYAPCDQEYMIEVAGKFHTADLSNATTNTWWSVNYPFILLWAALYHLEVGYRNTEGANDWEKAIFKEITNLDFNVAEELAQGVVRMEG